MKKYTKSHEWIEIDNELGTVGVTAFAQKELGDIVFVELPKKNKMVKAGEEAAVLESTKAAADVYSPVTGEIIATNEALKEATDPVNLSPEQDGWLFKVKLQNKDELKQLLDETEYQALTRG